VSRAGRVVQLRAGVSPCTSWLRSAFASAIACLALNIGASGSYAAPVCLAGLTARKEAREGCLPQWSLWCWSWPAEVSR
jgi:hypothetical protein